MTEHMRLGYPGFQAGRQTDKCVIRASLLSTDGEERRRNRDDTAATRATSTVARPRACTLAAFRPSRNCHVPIERHRCPGRRRTAGPSFFEEAGLMMELPKRHATGPSLAA
jgi:hypothetical protein